MKGKIRMSKARLSKKAKENLKRNAREKDNKFIKMEFKPKQIGLVETECYDLDTGKSRTIFLDVESMRKTDRVLDRLVKLGMAMGW